MGISETRRMEQLANTKAIHITQLGVIAALVDGEASQVEVDTLVAKVSERYKISADEVARLAAGMIGFYQSQQIGNSPAVALHFAGKSLDNLSAHDKKVAFDIAQEVILSGGVDAMEQGFLAQLKHFTRV